MKHRAYSLLTIKSVSEDDRVVTGIATTPETDRMGDVVEPKGAEFKLPLPLLWQHQSDKPIGHVTSAKVTNDGIEVTAQIAKVTEPGPLKDLLDMAWQSIKAKLVRGFSIGFQPLEHSRIEGSFGLRFLRWEWLELSAVTIPANSEATIQTIKSLDKSLLAASGHEQREVVRLGTSPGVSGTRSTPPVTFKEKHMKTVAQQIADFEAKRAASAARLEAIMTKSAEEGRTLDAAEAEEHDTLSTEVVSIDAHLVRLRSLEATQKASAKPAAGSTAAAASEVRSAGPAIIVNREPEEKFKGQMFTRMTIAKALAHMNQTSAAVEAQRRGWHKTHPTLFSIIKANEVASGGETSGEWGAELVQADTRYTGDFIDYLYSLTVYDRLPLRQVPANVVIKGQDGAATGYWVGEGKAIPVSASDFSTVSLSPLKVGALSVVSNELLRDSSPSAEALVRDALAQASAQRVDNTFLSAVGATGGVSPAGMLNGVSAIPASGWDADALRADVKSLYAAFIAAKNANGLQFVMNPALAKAIQLMVNALGQSSFPGVTTAGGTLLGDPVTTGDNVNALHLILLKPSDIYRIGDSGIQVSVSRDATIEMSSAPAGAGLVPTGQTENPVNMFQSESTAFKVVRSINFAKRRSSAVQYVADAEYGTETSST